MRVVNQLLTEMDGLEERKQVFVMAATNRPGKIHGPACTHTHGLARTRTRAEQKQVFVMAATNRPGKIHGSVRCGSCVC